MDPTVALTSLRELIASWRELENPEGRSWSEQAAADELAEDAIELMVALDEWLTKGGFLPADWQQATRPPSLYLRGHHHR